MNPDRITWEEYALRIAETASLRSEDPFKKVGACALDHNNMILGVGYNGLAQGKKPSHLSFWEDRDLRRPYMLHAEVNCLSLFKKGEARLLACTLLPCSSCASMIVAYNINTVVYKEDYEKDEKAKDIFNFYKVDLVKL